MAQVMSKTNEMPNFLWLTITQERYKTAPSQSSQTDFGSLNL